jgi:hypothetical protein
VGLPSCHESDARRRAGGLRVHTRESHAFTRNLIDRGRSVTAYGIERFAPKVTETDVVDQNVENVRRLAAVFLAKRGEFLVDDLIVVRPPLANKTGTRNIEKMRIISSSSGAARC